MFSDKDLVKLIFGLKVQLLRRDKGYNYQELSDKTGLAISYLHGIEKGKKYPKADKIFTLANVLGTDYNYLVSLNGDKRIQPIIDLLQSDFLKVFPLQRFGIDPTQLLDLLARTPDKVTAFVRTVLKITRNYRLRGEDFFQAALRSYQDLYDNYFPKIEESILALREKTNLPDKGVSTAALETVLEKEFGVIVERDQISTYSELKSLRSYYNYKSKVLHINSGFTVAQENFLIGKEIGYQALGLMDRPYTTRMLDVRSFEELLANFKASYFSVGLLLPQESMIAEIKAMTAWPSWQPEALLSILDRYHVTPEMLLQRWANLLPHHFGIEDVYFLRFNAGDDLGRYTVTKEVHLAQLHAPHANETDEHYCRRWGGIRLIRKLRALQSVERRERPIASAQISHYHDTPDRYLALSLAKPTNDNPAHTVSVTLGLRADGQLSQLFPWINHQEMIVKQVHTACERCPIADCGARAAAPTVLQQEKDKQRLKAALKSLKQSAKDVTR